LAEAMAITPEMIQEALGGLPPQSIHCSELSVEALNKAIRNIAGES
jgi:nitrogen fixation protein NifU and related proteins